MFKCLSFFFYISVLRDRMSIEDKGYVQLGEGNDTLTFRPCEAADVPRCLTLEVAGYPEDEAATLESLTFRQANAPGYFLVACSGRTVVGFVCGTSTCADSLTHDSMSLHEPEGTTLCVHSVCVEGSQRRRKVGTRMLAAYLQYVRACSPSSKEVRLICKKHLTGFYEQGGFTLIGPSNVVHGQEQWFEMKQSLLDL